MMQKNDTLFHRKSQERKDRGVLQLHSVLLKNPLETALKLNMYVLCFSGGEIFQGVHDLLDLSFL